MTSQPPSWPSPTPTKPHRSTPHVVLMRRPHRPLSIERPSLATPPTTKGTLTRAPTPNQSSSSRKANARSATPPRTIPPPTTSPSSSLRRNWRPPARTRSARPRKPVPSPEPSQAETRQQERLPARKPSLKTANDASKQRLSRPSAYLRTAVPSNPVGRRPGPYVSSVRTTESRDSCPPGK